MNEELKDKIKEYLKNKNIRSLAGKLRHHKLDFEKKIIEATSFLEKNANVEERVYCILNDIISHPICTYCKINTVKFNSFETGYRKNCSVSCALTSRYSDPIKLNEANIKRRKTNIEKYGSKGACIGIASDLVKKAFAKEKEEYDRIKELYTNEEVNSMLNSKEFYYKKYIRKRKC